MNFPPQNPHETSHVNSSMNSSTSHPQTPSSNFPNEAHKFSHQERPLPPLQNYESHIVPKSYYSSINNILPCTEAENPDSKGNRGEYNIKTSEGTPFSSITFQDSTKSTHVLSSRQKTSLENSLTGIERASTRNPARPPLNPNDVSRGISALHQKVDDLLRKTSQARRKSVTEGDRPQRAVSSDCRTLNNPSNILTMNALQPETPSSAIAQCGLLIDLSSNKHQDLSYYSSVKTEPRESTPQVRSLKAPASPYQDLLFKDKALFSTPKGPNSPRSESKDAGRSSFRVEMARYYTDTKPPRRQEQTPSNANKSSSRDFNEGYKPKYDHNKLEAIISRIKERNSVSPAPRQRSSVTLQDANTPVGANSTNTKAFWSTSKKNDELYYERKEVRTEERASVVPINWQYSHIVHEKSIEEIPNEKDVNITGNTTILEILEKKRSSTSIKLHDEQPEDENNKKNTTKSKLVMPGEKKLRIVAPKTTGKSNAAGASTIYLQDILKELQIDRPLKIKESTKEPAGSAKILEVANDKAKGITNKQGFELKETSVNIHDVRVKSRGTETVNPSLEVKNSSKYFAGENNDLPKQILHNIGSVTATNSKQQTGIREKSVGRGQEVFEERIKPKENFQPLNKLNFDKVKGLEFDNKPHSLPQANTKIEGKTIQAHSPLTHKRTDDDSLALDDSVFSVKEGGVNTHRQININGSNSKDLKNNERNKLDTTVIKKRFLQEEGDISDFDFERNRLDFTELERSRLSLEGLIKFEDNYLENMGVKKQKFLEGRTQTLGVNERILPKNEAPKNGLMSRAK